MVELSDFEKETLAWGSRYVKKPWAEMVEKMGRIGAGEQLTKEERMIRLELVPWVHFDIKVAMNITTTYLYDLLKIPNATMFTIILGEKGKRIIWASMEHEENGIYQEFVPIKDRLDEEWAKEAAKLIVENRLDDLFKYLSDLNILDEDDSGVKVNFKDLYKLNPDKAFKYYYNNVRDHLKKMFPLDKDDGTTIINGTVLSPD